MSQSIDVAVLGATGAVGSTLIEILEQREFPVGKLYALASKRSAGETLMFRGKPVMIEDAAEFDWSKVKLAFFAAGGSVSAELAPRATAAGVVVIDKTSQFRYEPDIPLIVPEVNGHLIGEYKQRGIIACPNCSTIQMVVALKPIHDAVGIDRINVATYQAVSGTGKAAIEELVQQTAQLLNGKGADAKVYPKQIAFNVLPHIDSFQENGYTKEEMKLVWETQKILGDDSIRVNATAVRVPVFYGHSEAVAIETRKKITAEEATKLLKKAPGVKVVDSQKPGGYATPVTEAAGEDPVFVSRIREDISHPNGLNLWIVSDNVRKGAALNSVQIAEMLVKEYF